ncbi:DinB family protein [Candidatus Bipolaricaulota bacterium]
MSEIRLEAILHALDTKRDQWFGGPSPAGSLRNVQRALATRRMDGLKHCIWELALHIAYWEYAVRRVLVDGPKGGFARKPSNWPSLPNNPSEETWKADRKLVKEERDALVSAIGAFDAKRLDEPVSSKSKRTHIELLIGVVQHSVYHTGQIALLKRLASES